MKYDNFEKEDLIARIHILEARLRTLEARSLADSWRLNPDRSGGQFDPEEIERFRNTW